MTVLQQDEAKTFFEKNDEKGLYKLFLKGSMLETINITNKKTMQEILQMNEANEVKSWNIIIFFYFSVRRPEKYRSTV